MMRTYWLVGSDDASKEKTLTNTDKDKAISMNSIDNVIVTDKVEQQGKVHTSILLCNNQIFRVTTLTLNAPITTKVVCFFLSAEMFKKPLWQTVWIQIRLLL